MVLNVVDNWNVDETQKHAARRYKKVEKVGKDLKRILVESEERYTWMKERHTGKRGNTREQIYIFCNFKESKHRTRTTSIVNKR